MLLLLLACSGPSKVDPCPMKPEIEGQIKATIDGEVWAAITQWNAAGSGIQLTSTSLGGYRLTLVAQVDDEERTAEESLDALPATFSLGGSGGSAAVTPDQGESSSTSNHGSGSLSITSQSEDTLQGCFSFTAGTSSGAEVVVEDGTFWSTPLGL